MSVKNSVFAVTAGDKLILRELAVRAAEIGNNPVIAEKAELWNRLNNLRECRPLVFIWQRVANVPWNELNYNDELTLRTESPFARELEQELRQRIYRFTHLPDDSVFEPKIYCTYEISDSGYGVEEETEQTDVSVNDISSRHYRKVIETEDDLEKIHTPVLRYDAEKTAAKFAALKDIFDGVLDVEYRLCRDNDLAFWAPAWDRLVRLMGVEEVLLGFAMNPELMHKAVDRLMNAGLELLDQFDRLPLPLTNASNETTGSGGLAFHNGLQERTASGNLKNLWGCASSQIFAQGSPEMHNEFAIEYEKKWLERFGLAYYGCCEPLHNRIQYLRKIPNLRKISVSPWADLEKAVENIGQDYVLSVKVNPFSFADSAWNIEKERSVLKEILDKTKGCHVEIILKDVSTVNHEPQRLWQWAEMARGLVGS